MRTADFDYHLPTDLIAKWETLLAAASPDSLELGPHWEFKKDEL